MALLVPFMNSPQSVLIAHPDASVALEIQSLFLDAGYQVKRSESSFAVAMEALLDDKIDLLVTDVHLDQPDDGIQLAERAKALDIPAILIADTADLSLFEKIKKVKAIAFLVRPFDPYSLLGAIELSCNSTDVAAETASNEVLFFKSNHLLIRVRLEDLLYIFAEGNYCTLVERSRRLIVKMSMQQIASLLPSKDFIQVHRNYMVKVDEIESISLAHNELHIFGQVIPVSRQKFREDLLKRVKAV